MLTKSKRPIQVALLCALTLSGCSPAIRTTTKLVAPNGVTLDKGTLRLEASVDGAPSGLLALDWVDVEGGVEARTSIHAAEADVLIMVFADLDGDGKPSAGDLVGTLAEPVHVRDDGMCSGNHERTPDIRLEPFGNP